MGGADALRLLSLLPRAGLFLMPVGVAITTYIVCQVLRVPPDRALLYTAIAFFAALIVLIAILIGRRLYRRKSADKLADGLAAGGGDRGEVEALRRHWKESVAKLKGTAVGGGGSRALAALPWFVIIGAPASGKSTLLRESGIDFPVGDAAIRGLQGTRNCDWWFSNIGVFLDTAGRYISDASAAEWAQFLELVRKHRSGAPIHGVIVALPAPDLLERNADQLALDARRIRARLDELIDHLGVNFPVWIVLTKVDLIGGFVEFFGHADAATRAQMLGWTAEQAEGARFDSGAYLSRYRQMVHRLREMRPALVTSCELRGRPAAFSFPDEMAALEEPLRNMLATIFEPNVYQETPLFRGLYVTSATQQGTPLQRAAARIRDLLGAPRVDDDGGRTLVRHAYFVKDLMHERIVDDQAMTWTTSRELERGRNKRVGVNLMGASVGVLLFLTVMAFGIKASRELGVIEDNVAKLSRERGSAVHRSAALREAARLASADNGENLGLSQQRSLRQDLVRAEEVVYGDEILTPLLSDWEREIRETPVDRGMVDVISRYEDFLVVESLLLRAVDPAVTPAADVELEPSVDDDDRADRPGDATAPDIDRPFTADEQRVLHARVERLRVQRILAPRDDTPGAVDLLLDAIWENHGAAVWMDDLAFSGDQVVHARPIERRAWLTTLLSDVHAAFSDRLKSYCRDAGAAVRRLEGDQAAQVAYVAERRRALESAAERTRLLLLSGDLERQDLRDALTDLVDAAAGRDMRGPGLDGGEGDVDDALVSSIGVVLEALRSGRLPGISTESIAQLEGGDAMARWADRTGGDPADALARLAPMEELARALERERRALAEGRLVPRPWPAERSGTIREALDDIDASVRERTRAWEVEVQPHLATLAGVPPTEYGTDVGRWGLGVERIVPTVIRDELLATFLGSDRRGTFARLARQATVRARERDGTFARDTLSLDLEELLAPAALASADDPDVVVTLDCRADAERLAERYFVEIVDQAREHWDARCRAVPAYRGAEPWDYLALWVESGSDIAELAAALDAAWGDGTPESHLRESPAWNAARRIWEDTRRLQQRYSFFREGFADLRSALGKLYSRRDFAPTAAMGGALADLAQDLGIPDSRPVWDAERLTRSIGVDDPVDESTRRDLRAAVNDAEDELVSRLERYFNGRWERSRRRLEAALRDADATALDDEREDLERDLRAFFGDDLSQRPGQRLGLSSEFRSVWHELTSGNAVARSLTLELRCTLLPVLEGGDARLPYLQLEYLERGDAEPRQMVWQPNRPEPWTVDCAPGQGVKLTIWMISEDRSKREEFRHWSGPDALIDALRDGGGGAELSWQGRGRFSESAARFQATATDPAALRAVLDPRGPELTTRMRSARCVELLDSP